MVRLGTGPLSEYFPSLFFLKTPFESMTDGSCGHFDHRRPAPELYTGRNDVFEYTIESLQGNGIQAVEASVLWYTEGKGDEDMVVHYFEAAARKV